MIRGRRPRRVLLAVLGNHWLGLAVVAGVALDYAIVAARAGRTRC
jgi:hypothetical protein